MQPVFRVLTACAVAGWALAAGASSDNGHCENPRVSYEEMARSFHCNANLRTSRRAPILLVPGTFATPEWFAWNYLPALADEGWPVCTVRLPANATAPMQLSAEYIAFAIRTAYRQSGRRVAIIGFSQGGMSPRWVLRFAPETRHMVDELIALGPSNHGADITHDICDLAPYPDADGTVGCPPAFWQQRPASEFLGALNAGFETVPEVDYTVVYSREDGVIGLGSRSARLSALKDGGSRVANIALQQLCPANGAQHFDVGSFDPVAFAVVIDALRHPGPARRYRLLAGGQPGSQPYCAAVFMAGVDATTFEEVYADALAAVGDAIQGARNVEQEPAIPCYARPGR
jgi:hypothetical protein